MCDRAQGFRLGRDRDPRHWPRTARCCRTSGRRDREDGADPDRHRRARPVSAGRDAAPAVKTGSLHASLIEGGTSLSTYPDRCRVQIERRTIPGETDAIVEQQLREMIGDGAELTMGISRQPFEIAPDAPFVTVAALVIEGASDNRSGGRLGRLDGFRIDLSRRYSDDRLRPDRRARMPTSNGSTSTQPKPAAKSTPLARTWCGVSQLAKIARGFGRAQRTPRLLGVAVGQGQARQGAGGCGGRRRGVGDRGGSPG